MLLIHCKLEFIKHVFPRLLKPVVPLMVTEEKIIVCDLQVYFFASITV